MVFIRRRVESLANLVARLLQIPIDFLTGFLGACFSVMKNHPGIVFRLLSRLVRFFARPFVIAGRARSQDKGAKYQDRQFHAIPSNRKTNHTQVTDNGPSDRESCNRIASRRRSAALAAESNPTL